MNYLVLSVGILLMSISAVHCRSIRGRLSKINQWFITGDKEIVYPVALIIGLSVACIASWLRWVLV